MSQSLFTVSLYDTLGPDASEYIIKHAGLACVVTSLGHVGALLRIKPRLPHLKFLVILDDLAARTGEPRDGDARTGGGRDSLRDLALSSLVPERDQRSARSGLLSGQRASP